MVELKKYTSRNELIEELSANVISMLQHGIDRRDAGSMLLSGGSTPGALYNKMSNTSFDWQKVWFAPTDERWVDAGHPDSNEKMIRNTLLINKAAAATYIGLKSDGEDPVAGAQAVEEKLAPMPMPFDVVLLGMGEDGHFASLFPNLEDTRRAMDVNEGSLCYPIRRDGDDHDRMTMTYKSILNAKQIILLFFGESKLRVFEQAAQNVSDHLPISHLLNQSNVPVHLYWAD